MRSKEFIIESAASELAKHVGSLRDYKYKTIGALMARISTKHDISQMDLHHRFVSKYGKTPDHWIKDRSAAAAAKKLQSKLKGMKDTGSRDIDDLIKKIAADHKITASSLEKIYTKKYKRSLNESTTDFGPDLPNTMFFSNSRDLDKATKHISLLCPDKFSLGTKLLNENSTSSDDTIKKNYGNQAIVKKFIAWTAKKLNLKNTPEFEFSYDTQEAQDNHHTGGHVVGSGVCWVYVANRNMVDVFRTVAHEMVHVRQHELGMIKPGDSYPGSPIEVLADAVAGKLIKIFGKQHHEIFQ